MLLLFMFCWLSHVYLDGVCDYDDEVFAVVALHQEKNVGKTKTIDDNLFVGWSLGLWD